MRTLLRRSVSVLSLAAAGLLGCGSGTTLGTTQAGAKAPTANAGGPYAGKIGLAVAFSGAGSSDPQGQTLTYTWNFGDNTTGTGVSPSHAYSTTGTFPVSLTVVDTSNLSATVSTTATISAQAPIASAGGPYAGKTGTAIAFTGAGSSDPQGQPLTYLWSFGDGATGTGVSPSHAYAAVGTFSVTLTVTNTSGVSATTTTTAVIAAQAPTANANGPYAGKIGVALAFTGAGSSDPQGQMLTYAWNFGDGGTGTGAGPTHAYSAAGTYTVLLTVTDTSGLIATAMATATITAQPPIANAGGPYTGKIGVAVAFSGAASSDPQAEPLTYAWSFGDGTTGAGVSPNHAYSAAGTYTVSLTVTNTSSLTSTTTTTAVITAQPPMANAGGPYTGKIGVAIAFSGAGSSDPQGEALTYAWSFGDSTTGTGVSPTHAYSAAGTYTVSLTVTNTSNLTTTATTTAVITAQAPVANAGGPYSSNIGLAILFSGAGSSDPQGETLTYAWSFGDGGMGTGVSPSHTYSSAGTFTVSLTVTNTSGLSTKSTTTATITARAPVANAGGPYSGVTGTAVSFSGSGSSDPQGETLTYAWTFGDGGTATGVSPTHTYSTASTFTVSLTVTNTSGLSATATTTAAITLQADFTLFASPQSVAIPASSSEVFDLSVTALNGFTGNVTVKLGTLPSGVTSPISTYTVTPGIVTLVTLNSTASVSSTVAALTVTGTSGSLSHTAQVELTTGTAADFSVFSSSSALSLLAGSSQVLSVTATAINGFTGTIAGQVTGLAAGLTATPSSFTLTPGMAQNVTVTAGSSVALGNSVFNFVATSGTTVHSTPVVVNVGTQAQDFVFGAPLNMNLSANSTATLGVEAYGVGGFDGVVSFTVSGLPNGVTVSAVNSTVNTGPGAVNHKTLTLTGGPSLIAGTYPLLVTETATTVAGTVLTHTTIVMLTLAPSSTVTATVATGTPGTAFPAYYVGFSFPSTTLQEFAGTGATTTPSFINLLSNLKTYIGSPSIRSTMPNSSANVTTLGSLTTGATFTVAGVTTTPKYFLTMGSGYAISTDQTYVQSVLNTVGTKNVAGFELDNEPDLYVQGGLRPAAWTYADYLTESAGYQQALASYITAPQYIMTAEGGRYWDVGIPAALTEASGQLSLFTAHLYALSACDTPAPTIAQLLADDSAHQFYTRWAALTQTMGSLPVRVGEMNSLSCTGLLGVSNTFAASLWLVDTAFEAKAGGAAGFNIHSNGTTTGGAAAYDIGYTNSSGNLSVYAPFYGLLFFAEAIQNGAKVVPVTVTQSSGNVKVWATIDASNTVRVVVLEKDTDGLSATHTVSLNLGGYSKAGTVATMSAPSVSATSGIKIAGQTFDGTTNGLLTGTSSTSSVTPVSGVYTLTVADGTATMLTVPQ